MQVDLGDLKGAEKRKWKKALEDIGYDFDEVVENAPIMTPENEFEDYAADWLDEVYAPPEGLQPYIDYEAFASDLRMDYMEIEVDGVTYLFRAY